jgi:hypothetical protein
VAGSLPNEGVAGPPPYYGSDNVQAGDFAYVAGDSTFYVCTLAGTAAGGGATWVALVSGSVADADRFAPKYLVGGPSDTAAALAGTQGFWFFPDTGDGAGIEAALSAAGVLAGDVYIRPGTFDLTGVASLPLVVPADVRVVGAGSTTVLTHSFSSGPGTVFQLGAGAELRDMKIEVTDTGDGTGNGVVEATGSGRSYCERVEVTLTRDPASTSTLLSAFFADDGATLEQDRCVALLDGSNSTPGGPPAPIDPVAPPAPTGTTWTVGTLGGEDYPDINTALANASVVDGDRLLLSAQTFTSTAITVSKQVTIQGVGLASTVVQTAGAAGDPVVLFTISVSNVTLRDMTIKQRKTTNTSIETAVSITAGAGSSGHYLEAVRVETMEFGVVIRSDGWQINNCELAYVGPNNSTRRLIGVYRSDGQGLFTNSTFDSGQNGVITGNTRVFTVLATTGLPSEVLGGYLRLGNITPSNAFPVQQFFNAEWFQPGATPLTFYVDGCTSSETSAFVVWTCADTQPPLAQSASVVMSGNTLTNVHGKGVYALNGSHAVIGNPGTTTFYADSNTLGATAFIGTWASGVSAPANATEAAQVGYDTLRWTNPSQPLQPSLPVPPIPADALAGWRAASGNLGGKLRLDMVRHLGGDAGVVAFGQTDVDESNFNEFGVVGVYCAGADLAVTGGTKLISTNSTAVGIQIAQNQTDINLLVNARITLPFGESTSSVGILSDAATGQITASRISAETGIDTSAGAGAGVAIGFNVVEGTSQIVPNGTTDEVAHNILF